MRLALALVVISTALAAVPPAHARPVRGPAPAAAEPLAALAAVPLTFVENRGQRHPRTLVYSESGDRSIAFAHDAVAVTLRDRADRTRAAVVMSFEGASNRAAPVAADRRAGVVSYFRGSRDRWSVGLATFGRVEYGEVWPGIAVAFRGEVDRLKSDFVVYPGADPRRITLRYAGAADARIDARGALVLTTPAGVLVDEAPFAYQDTGGRRVPVPVAYALSAGATKGTWSVGFRLGAYDRSLPLVVDPSVVVQSGFVGGSFNDSAGRIAIDAAGNVYVAGITASRHDEEFPVVTGPDTTFNPDRGGSDVGRHFMDAFVAKVRADGTGLVYCGYIGGVRNQGGAAVAVDAGGNAYVVGATDSTADSFPATVGPDLSFGGGDYMGDGFVAKVNPAGTGLVFCGYIGGEGSDHALDVAVDAGGSAYVAGVTASASFPAVVGPRLTFGGIQDAFVVKVRADGSGFAYAGYIGGTDADRALGLAVDEAGAAYVGGFTRSTDFPVSIGPGLAYAGGASDGFLVKVAPDGSGLAYAGLVGGAGADVVADVAVDQAGAAYVTGGTTSTESSFPVLGGPGLAHAGAEDGFVARVRADGTGFAYSGYIGGDGSDAGTAIAVDSRGYAYVSGLTTSSEATFPVKGGPDLTYGGGALTGDAFAAKVASNGAGLSWCGYIGGSDDDLSVGIAVVSPGDVYVAGSTFSTEATFPVMVGPYLSKVAIQDAFVTRLNEPPDFELSVDPPALSAQRGAKGNIVVNVERMGGFDGNVTVTAPATAAIKVKLTPASASTRGELVTFKYKVKKRAAPGSYTLTFTGRDAEGRERSATLTLTVT